ncbi:GNAT family N-acetyltransferase [Halomarina oriensis]|uniref:GNAT family N-acetyltransferase n=1 Tax=Halomarina oriensis TaxID=671145 RepID=A0A6B0GVX6_9EURY|nr:GNAT family N-acetyltransferase [Halomarina oriensis]MWG35878.1 GNAT family N-acetyltransferase [Halomarina oriensis]
MPETVDLSADDAEAVHALYQQYGWWDDRTLVETERALANTPVAVGVRQGDELVASARVVTDYTFYANVFDVIVAEDRRGEGDGEQLLRGVVEHPDLAAVNPTLLCREGLVAFYESCGFKAYPESVDVPEGGREDLHRLVYSRPDDD